MNTTKSELLSMGLSSKDADDAIELRRKVNDSKIGNDNIGYWMSGWMVLIIAVTVSWPSGNYALLLHDDLVAVYGSRLDCWTAAGTADITMACVPESTWQAMYATRQP